MKDLLQTLLQNAANLTIEERLERVESAIPILLEELAKLQGASMSDLNRIQRLEERTGIGFKRHLNDGIS